VVIKTKKNRKVALIDLLDEVPYLVNVYTDSNMAEEDINHIEAIKISLNIIDTFINQKIAREVMEFLREVIERSDKLSKCNRAPIWRPEHNRVWNYGMNHGDELRIKIESA